MNFANRATTTRTRFIASASIRAIGVAMLLASADAAYAQADTQAGSKVPDPADSSSSAANPNEAADAADKKAANAAVTGDVTPAQNEAIAQRVGGAVAQATDSQQAGDIVVTGFRASLETAVAEKKNRDQIVESVSAEDIGKLPDASIAESIARLPGLAAQRTSGRAQSVSIRGFSPDLSSTTLNGREQTSTGDNRAVDYDQYPSEVINQVLVYKTPMASLVGQGLSGTVDLRTIRPIEFGRRVVSVGARGTFTDLQKFNPDSTRYGYRANATYVDQFFDDRVGVALSASYIDEPYQIQEFNAWGYSNGGPKGSALIGGEKSYATSTKLQRIGTTGTIEFRPVPEFTSTIDGFYSHFKDDQTKRGVELPLGFGVGDFFGTTYNQASTTSVVNGTAVNGTFGGVQAIVRNDAQVNEADLYSFGWNNAYKGDDGWNAQLDLSYSRTDRSNLSVESYAGTGRGKARGATDTIGFVTTTTGSTFTHKLNYADPNLILLTDPAGYGGGDVNQAGYYNDRRTKDRIYQIRTEIEKEIENFPISSIQVGMNYTNHKKSLTPDESFVTLPNGQQEAKVPGQYLRGTANFEYSGLGRTIAYDPFELLQNGVLTLIPRTTSQDVLTKAFNIQEDLLIGYVQANIAQDIGASKLTGNFGIQFIETEQKASGLVFGPAGNQPRTYGADYLDALPSLNLSLRLPSDFVFRGAVAREQVRPRMDDMRLSLGYGVDTGAPGGAIIRGSSGNPQLRPYRATAYDATIEKYFGNKGYLAVQGFYKKLDSYVYRNQEVPYDFSGLPLAPGSIATVSNIGTINQPINLSSGKLYGVEVAGTLPFGQIVGFLDGFGVTGGASYTKTEIAPPGMKPIALPGYSKYVANGTAFFEKWGFSARGSIRYRSGFLGELVGFGADRVLRQARGETLIDAQVGYDFGESFLRGLSLYIQGQNLTDEPFVTEAGNSLNVIDYQKYGRRYQAGFTYKF